MNDSDTKDSLSPANETSDLEKSEERRSNHDRDQNFGSDNLRAVDNGSSVDFSLKGVLSLGVESRGILPVPFDQRVDPHFSKTFFIWLSANCNILSFSAGTLGPLAFGLGLRDTFLTILFFNLLCCALPGYLATWGPKLGLRQMCQARYSFGLYGAIIPSVLNLTTMMGFLILNCILGGSTLASVSNGNLSWTVGIVIVAVLSLIISFCGYQVINWYERVAWFPVLIVYLIALGVSGHHLHEAPPPATPATAGTILSFASTLAGFVLTYSPLMSDYTCYLRADVSSWKVFFYTYLGLLVPVVIIQTLGAAFACALPAVPAWSTAYDSDGGGNVGGLLLSILEPAGTNFGKFLTVILALSVTANTSPTIYSCCLSFQVFVPWAVRVPRYIFAGLIFAIATPISIVGAHKFYTTLINFTGIIGYWASCFGAIVLTEHIIFRHLSFPSYDLTHWNDARNLPPGIAALSACIIAVGGIVVVCMDQVWFVGPVAKRIGGDLGFEVAFFATGLVYLPLRWLEKRVFGR
ncbi:purine-cytosine permease [Sistotremastrum suecicum HHB10207 ss-3]|uniref:Purine-cytosine permease n=1 Tax=Sistotremastrum suecicum HHB10207 ss-3 TaxID=1314776 RepID=A0A166EC35_9AGAM|nr:purine-cytosine permease [Sistotremastrum suecicum HHB10207 ss-3]